jgi:hypothetical protein
VLRKETRGSVFDNNFVYFSKTDNGHQPLSILLQAEQINANVIQLEYALTRKDFTAIARVLQQEGRTCEAGDTHVSYLFQKYPRLFFGAPTGTNVSLWWGAEVVQSRMRVENEDSFCTNCDDYICPTCHEGGSVWHLWEMWWNWVPCLPRRLSNSMSILWSRKKCEFCVKRDGEDWWSMEEVDNSACPTCAQANQQDRLLDI